MPSLEEAVVKAFSDTQYALMFIQKGLYTVYPLGRGNLTTDGNQYGDVTSASATATTQTVATATIAPPGVDEDIDEVEFSLTAGFRSTTTTATTVKFFWEAKDSTATSWTALCTACAITATASTDRTMSGRFATTSGFSKVPFNLRLRMTTGTASRGQGKVKSSSYVKVLPKKA